jgi:hypothetical protein
MTLLVVINRDSDFIFRRLAAFFFLVSCLSYSLTLKIESVLSLRNVSKFVSHYKVLYP